MTREHSNSPGGETSEFDRRISALEAVASSVHSGLSSICLGLVVQIKAFLEWRDIPLPAFSGSSEGPDKFAGLVRLSSKQQDCSHFYATEVGVNHSTVWRWGTGKSRPSVFVGVRLAKEIELCLTSALHDNAVEKGLAPPLA